MESANAAHWVVFLADHRRELLGVCSIDAQVPFLGSAGLGFRCWSFSLILLLSFVPLSIEPILLVVISRSSLGIQNEPSRSKTVATENSWFWIFGIMRSS